LSAARETTLRWLLTDEFSDELDGMDPMWRPLGACVEVRGLFADLPEPARERFTLLGCVPEPNLRDAPPHLGDVFLEPVVGGVTDDYTWLYDVTVTAIDADRVELTGRVQQERHLQPETETPEADEFRLTLGDDTVLARCRTVDGVFRKRPELARPPVTLIGFRPEPWFESGLSAWRADGTKPLRLSATIAARAADGHELSTLQPGVFADVVAVRASEAGPELLDVDLDDGVWEPIPTQARDLWAGWMEGRPAEFGTWVPLSAAMRHEWLRLALADHRYGAAPDRPAGGVHRLAGRHVTDLNAFFCAMGEAVNGPGGYFGWNPAALEDCLHGKWGATTPFRLLWSDAEVARQHLGEDDFTRVVGWLTEKRVDVVLE
jgi:hypothetical protein